MNFFYSMIYESFLWDMKLEEEGPMQITQLHQCFSCCLHVVIVHELDTL